MKISFLEDFNKKTYKGKNKKVKIYGKEYDAYFPKDHSEIEGLVFHRWDANAGDSYANISNMQLTFYVLKHGSKKWESITDKKWETSSYYRRMGYYGVLFELENDETKELTLKADRIAKLRKKVPKLIKELEELECYFKKK